MPKGARNSSKTRNVKAFLAANEASPVIEGWGYKSGGGGYKLADGKIFSFTLAECQSFPVPRWDYD